MSTSRSPKRRRKQLSVDDMISRIERDELRLERKKSSIGMRLRHDRKRAGFTLAAVSRASGVNACDLSQIERGILYRHHLVIRVQRALRAMLAEQRASSPAPIADADDRVELAS